MSQFGFIIQFLWVSRHTGVVGNKIANNLLQSSLLRGSSVIPLPFSNFCLILKKAPNFGAKKTEKTYFAAWFRQLSYIISAFVLLLFCP